MKKLAPLLLACCVCMLSFAQTLDVLIVDGQNNHQWQKTTPELREILEESGRFSVDVATSPPGGGDMSDFRPDFSAYDAIVLNYNGDMWPESTREAFETYVSGGGGVVVVHAADNAFREWEAYNRMIGFGGWGGRTKADGPYIYFKDGVLVYDHHSDGRGGGHEGFGRFVVTTRDFEHPITQGMPEQWYQTDELYNFMRGPGGDMHVLATAFSSDPIGKGGSQRHEPMLFTVTYGDGHIFHTTLGHNVEAMQGNGFRVTLARGTEWAATQRVTIAMPEEMPRVLKPHERLRD